MIEIAKIIKDQLAYHDMTQSELAKLIGVSSKTVSHWTTGRSEPDIPTLCSICTIFRISFDDMIEGKRPSAHGMVITDKSEISIVKEYRKLSGRNKGFFAQLVILILKISGDNRD